MNTLQHSSFIHAITFLSLFSLAGCGGGNTPSSASSNTQTQITKSGLFGADGTELLTLVGGAIPGWPDYIAMGAIGGPNDSAACSTNSPNPPGGPCVSGNDAFVGSKVDVVFKYAGTNGDGDPGMIDPPTNALRMTADLTAISKANGHASRVAMVEYTAQMSGGQNFGDFTNMQSATIVGTINNGGAGAGNTLTVTEVKSGTLAIGQTIASQDIGIYEGTISNGSGSAGTILNISKVASGGQLAVGQIIKGENVASNTRIVALGTGSGGVGTYTVNNSQYVPTPTDGSRLTASNGATGGKITAFGTGKGGVGTYTLDTSQLAISGTIYAGGSPTVSGNPSYIMARHFASLAADAYALYSTPVVYNNASYFGTLIMNPDLLGSIQQNQYTSAVNAALPDGAVNTAIDQALCVMTQSRTYLNKSNPNGAYNPPFLNKNYSGNPVDILKSMLVDGYPVYSIDGLNDAYWNTASDNFSTQNNTYSQVGTWFNDCIANPTYDKAKYAHPSFPAGFDGWVQANNWIIRALAPKGTVTFGWQENMWANGTGFWLHKDLSPADVTAQYSGPVINFLKTIAPSSIGTSGNQSDGYKPDYFVFDRYEMDDSAAPGSATLYNARSWDNYLTAVGQISSAFNNIPVMLWQIPGSHIPNTSEAKPELFQNTPGSYVFSTAPVYFFGDSNLKPDLSNIMAGTPSNENTNTAVGNYLLDCSSNSYNCDPGSTYKQYLLAYNGKSNNYNWSIDNNKLALAASKNVFAILWGGGNTTNVIKNFSNTTDFGWLAGKINNYFNAPTPVGQSR